MQKIPVARAVGEAYGFVVRRYFSILGILWLPYLILGAAFYLALFPFFQVLPDLVMQAAQNPSDTTLPFTIQERIAALAPRVWVADLIELAVFAVISVGIVKEAMGLRRGPKFVYVGFGLEELLVIGGYLFVGFMALVYTVVAAIVCAVVVAALMAAGGAGGGGAQASMGAAALAVLFASAIVGGGIYLLVRLAFFVVPVSVAERDFGVFRSWELTKGNFWRSFFVLFLSWLPLVLIELILSAGIGVFFGISIAEHMPKDETAIPAYVAGFIVQNIVRILPYIALFAVAFAPIVNGLVFSPAAFAYRALKEPEADAPDAVRA